MVHAEGVPVPAQIVGGGPRPERATIIVAEADAQKLRIRIENLDGNAVEEIECDARRA